MPVSNYIVIILVSLVVKLVDGNQRIVYVSESISDDEDFFASASGVSRLTDDEDFFTSGDVDGNLICCVYGNCSCNSLNHALANLTSNVLINITTDVTLSSLINALNLANISIIGHNNPTVNCKRAGGIHFNFCHNCIIQDITWDGCGTETEAGIKLSDSSNIVLENCFFQYSKGPNIVLLRVSGHVNINHCNFVHNNHYGGHGAAIYYSSSNVTNCLLFLTISNCNFTDNKHAKSLVYIKNMKCKYISIITFQDIMFYHNQGISVYVINQKIYLLKRVVFKCNTAKKGAGIYIKDHSTVILGKNSDVSFIQNSADYNGGAVFLRNHSSIIFDQNSMVTFNDNNATNGIIYSEVNCNVTFQETSEVTFSNNSVQKRGSSLDSSNNCHITFTGNAKVTFINNEVTGHHWWYDSGTIHSKHSYISFEGNSITLFRDNIASEGGAINSISSTISFEGNSVIEFTNNTARYQGGAIYSYDGFISFEEKFHYRIY